MIGSTVELFQKAISHVDSIDVAVKTSDVMDGDVCCMIVGLVIVVFAAASIPVAKVFDPSTMLAVSSLGVSVSLFIFGASLHFEDSEFLQKFSWLPLVNFIVYIGFFMVTLECCTSVACLLRQLQVLQDRKCKSHTKIGNLYSCHDCFTKRAIDTSIGAGIL